MPAASEGAGTCVIQVVHRCASPSRGTARRVATLTVVDANVLIGWLDDRDALHDAAIEILTAIDWFIVHPLTLAEVLVHHLTQDARLCGAGLRHGTRSWCGHL